MGILSHHSAWSPGPQGKPDQLSGDPTLDFARFSSPWMSKGVVPGNINVPQMFDFGEMLWIFDPTYRQAMKRLIGYFLTEIEFFDPRHSGELKEEDINNYREVLIDQLKIKTVIYTALCNLFADGNVLMSMLPPILRRMQCPSCKIYIRSMSSPRRIIRNSVSNTMRKTFATKRNASDADTVESGRSTT